MLAPTPPEEKEEPARRDGRIRGVVPVVISALLLGLFALACAWLMIALIEHDRMRSCFASGRHNCAPILD
jgi:hypothetical protein